MSEAEMSQLPPSDEWRCHRCHLVLPSPGEGRPPISCLSELGGCGRTSEWCEHDAPVEGCETCAQGHTRFFPASWGEAHAQLYIDAEMDPYRRLIDFYRRTFRTEDTAPLDVCLATVLTSDWDGDSLWVFVVAPPAYGKTATLTGFHADKDGCIFRITLTTGALVSGLKREHKDLLPRLNKKCLIIKDFTAILEMDRKARGQILGDLRAIYDGDFSKSFGSDVGDKEYVSKFNLLAAVTNIIEIYYSVDSVLGQRFLMVRMTFPEGFDSDAERDSKAIMAEFQEKVLALLKERRSNPLRPKFSEDQVRECKRLADEVGTLRTEVPRDTHGDLKIMPFKEGPARLTNQFEKLACGVAFGRAHAEVLDEDMKIVRRVACDTVPSVRREILSYLFAGPRTVREVCLVTGIGEWEVRRKLADLSALKVVSWDGEDDARFYKISRDMVMFRVESGVTPASPAPTPDSSLMWIPVGAPGLEDRLKPFGVPHPSEGFIALGADGIPTWSKRGANPETPSNGSHPKLIGAKNIMAISGHVRNKLRWDGGRSDSWIARDAILALQLPEDPESLALLEGFVPVVRKGVEVPP